MQTRDKTSRRHLLTTLQAAVLLVAGGVLGRMSETPHVVYADIRKSEPRQAFLSGGERSVEVLERMEKTLTTIDGRLERLEKHVLKDAPDQKR